MKKKNHKHLKLRSWVKYRIQEKKKKKPAVIGELEDRFGEILRIYPQIREMENIITLLLYFINFEGK